VVFIDGDCGTFELRSRQNRHNAPPALKERFNRLRERNFVRIEGRLINWTALNWKTSLKGI
jgi:hypothetical protein